MKTISYTKKALKFLEEITQTDAKRIIEKIEQYAQDPSSLKNQLKKLTGVPSYRLRVGDYRVVFNKQGIVLSIIKIDCRGNVYKEL